MPRATKKRNSNVGKSIGQRYGIEAFITPDENRRFCVEVCAAHDCPGCQQTLPYGKSHQCANLVQLTRITGLLNRYNQGRIRLAQVQHTAAGGIGEINPDSVTDYVPVPTGYALSCFLDQNGHITLQDLEDQPDDWSVEKPMNINGVVQLSFIQYWNEWRQKPTTSSQMSIEPSKTANHKESAALQMMIMEEQASGINNQYPITPSKLVALRTLESVLNPKKIIRAMLQMDMARDVPLENRIYIQPNDEGGEWTLNANMFKILKTVLPPGINAETMLSWRESIYSDIEDDTQMASHIDNPEARRTVSIRKRKRANEEIQKQFDLRNLPGQEGRSHGLETGELQKLLFPEED